MSIRSTLQPQSTVEKGFATEQVKTKQNTTHEKESFFSGVGKVSSPRQSTHLAEAGEGRPSKEGGLFYRFLPHPSILAGTRAIWTDWIQATVASASVRRRAFVSLLFAAASERRHGRGNTSVETSCPPMGRACGGWQRQSRWWTANGPRWPARQSGAAAEPTAHARPAASRARCKRMC